MSVGHRIRCVGPLDREAARAKKPPVAPQRRQWYSPLRGFGGTAVPLGSGLFCAVDRQAISWLTPLTSMFLHGSWMHLLGTALFLWLFGNNVEDSMGRLRFVFFYLLCGLVAAGAQGASAPSVPVPMVGASGALAGSPSLIRPEAQEVLSRGMSNAMLPIICWPESRRWPLPFGSG
ncbi:MAG: rhomboid family intramembrane serine protease [Deltaproteobacteria bacterium]|nr:rhomboid family intramembrane serine protease [Deltaproteobacteria bacterium]